ncbi:MAG: hypothetical protein IKQ97_02700 [Eubacterium sp.]|nr:hypothetical protein [Eubacterium sp.]
MKYCEYCGAQLQDDHSFCVKCGKKVESYPATPSPMMQGMPGTAPQPMKPAKEKSGKAPVILGICAGVAVISLVVGLLFANGVFSGGSEDNQMTVADQNSADGSTANAVPTATPTATPTPEPTPTPAPTKAPTPEPKDDNANPDAKIAVNEDAEDTGYQYEYDDDDYYNSDDDYYSDSSDYSDSSSYSGYGDWETTYEDSYVYPSSNYYQLDSLWLTDDDIDNILHLDELDGMSKYNKINVVLQTMFAHHGYIFSANPWMVKYFDTKTWYTGWENDDGAIQNTYFQCGSRDTETHNYKKLIDARAKYDQGQRKNRANLKRFLERKGVA